MELPGVSPLKTAGIGKICPQAIVEDVLPQQNVKLLDDIRSLDKSMVVAENLLEQLNNKLLQIANQLNILSKD